MRVVFFNRSYFPDVGATGQLLTELAEDLARIHGWDVTIVAGPSPGGAPSKRFRLVERERHEGVTILRARGTRFARRGFLGRFSNYLSYFFSSLLAGFELRGADVIVTLTDPPIVGLSAWVAARRTGARFVFVCQDVFPEVARLLEDFRSDFVERCLQSVNRFLVRRADRIVVLGHCMKRRLVEGKGAASEKIAVIHNWADRELLSPAPKANAFSREHGFARRFVVMHAGNMGLAQDLEMVIEAADRLRARDDIVFVLIGDGVRRGTLEEMVRARGLENVIFLPYQPRARMRESYASADVFLVSLKNGLAGYIVPSKLYGILAAGRPYVAAVEDISEVAAITRDHESGKIVAPGDVGGLVHEVTRLYRDRKLAERLGRNARRASSEYERTKQVRAYHELFTEELRAREASPAHAACEARL